MALSLLIPESWRRSLNNSFAEWFQTSTVQNKTPREPLGELAGVMISKNVMRWRFLLWRIMLNRPIFLWYAMRRMPSRHCHRTRGLLLSYVVSFNRTDRRYCHYPARSKSLPNGWLECYTRLRWCPYSRCSPILRTQEWLRRAELKSQGLTTLSDLRYWSNIARRSYDVVG